ncbi:hypothetical protein [Pseudomonas sp.]|uniref:hypothetical protein n=1 Tax=Pseudomonas sp. TaxID=306 RepID=UPI003F2A0415
MASSPPEVVLPPTTPDSNAEPILALNPAFITCDDAAAFFHDMLKGQRGTEFAGFILKNEQGHFVCATQTMPSDANADALQAPNFLLSVSVNQMAERVIPGGYTIEARLSSHAEKIKGNDEGAVEWGQRKLFFSVSDLFEVMTWRRKFSRCYLSASDGSLISYTSRNSAFEQELSPRFGRKPDGRLQTFESHYDAGAVPSSILILLAVAAGAVTTVVSGSLWRRRGDIKASWREDILQQDPPVERMPVYGPILKDASEVARYLHQQMLELSSTQQHVGMILKHRTQEFFIATVPVASDYALFSAEVLFPKDLRGNPLLPEDFRVHGFYHSISPISDDRLPSEEVELHRNFFSVNDLRVGLSRVSSAPHHRLFLCTPDGAVLRFAKPESDKVEELMARLDPLSDEYQDFEQKLISDETSPQSLVDLVAAAGVLGVLFTSKAWPKAGRVTPSVADGIVDTQKT